MPPTPLPPQAALPSLDRLLRSPNFAAVIDRFGRALVTEVSRSVLDEIRKSVSAFDEFDANDVDEQSILSLVTAELEKLTELSLKPVFNLTGTVLHTNLGRAILPEVAIQAMTDVARYSSNVEYSLARGRRGERDDHLESWICRLTGAEAATVVNNNAAAVLLVLNTFARRKEVLVSRGELVEIGGSFRIPDIMARAGARLIEVGTTNRTHPHDFRNAITEKTALVMKVHTSNYVIDGFTASVAEQELAAIAHNNAVPFVVDLGSGSLVDLEEFGLPHERTPGEVLNAGADLVTFSGDKLLGGPQAGIIAGRQTLITRIRRNPLKRALRVDKITTAALGAVLQLYADPAGLVRKIPTLRHLTRPYEEIHLAARRISDLLAGTLGSSFEVKTVDCMSQIGSGSLPVDLLRSAAVSIRPSSDGKRKPSGKSLTRLAAALRGLPIPVIGRIKDDALLLDIRCLDDEARFLEQFAELRLANGDAP